MLFKCNVNLFRYRSACCNLRYMLKPLMGLAPSLAEKCAGGEDDKILQVYQVKFI